jgi:hypothetical protein
MFTWLKTVLNDASLSTLCCQFFCEIFFEMGFCFVTGGFPYRGGWGSSGMKNGGVICAD